MVKLDPELQEEMENPSTDSMDALEDGFYHVRLESCTRSDEPTDKGYYLTLVWVDLDTGTWIWDRRSESKKASYKMREFFDALGYEYSSDTDEMVDAKEEAVIAVTKVQIAKGARKGQWGNDVTQILAPTKENLKLVTG